MQIEEVDEYAICPECGQPMIAIGEDILSEFDMASAYTYECPNHHTIWTLKVFKKSFEWMEDESLKNLDGDELFQKALLNKKA